MALLYPCFLRLINNAGLHNSSNVSAILDAIIAGAGCSVEDVAETAVSRLLQSLRRRAEKRQKCITLYWNAAALLAGQYGHPLGKALLRKRATAALTRGALQILDRRLYDDNEFDTTMFQYFDYLIQLLDDRSKPAPWLKEALVSGLFSVYVKYNDAITNSKTSSISLARFLLTDRNTTFLVFRSIVSAAKRAFRRISADDVVALCSGCLGQEWRVFTALLTEGMIIKDRFDLTENPSARNCSAVSGRSFILLSDLMT